MQLIRTSILSSYFLFFTIYFVRFEVLTVVVMKSCHLGCVVHWKLVDVSEEHLTSIFHLLPAASPWFFTWITLLPSRWVWHVPPKCQSTFNLSTDYMHYVPQDITLTVYFVMLQVFWFSGKSSWTWFDSKETYDLQYCFVTFVWNVRNSLKTSN
jgi:hypothetical protein